MNCTQRLELQANVEGAARELARAVHDAHVAIEPIQGLAAGNRIQGAEEALRVAGKALEDHQTICPLCSNGAQETPIPANEK